MTPRRVSFEHQISMLAAISPARIKPLQKIYESIEKHPNMGLLDKDDLKASVAEIKAKDQKRPLNTQEPFFGCWHSL